MRMYLTVEGFSPIIRANARTEGLATDFRYIFQYLMHASTSAFPFLRIHDSCVRCLPEEVIHCCMSSAPFSCVAHSVPRKADDVFVFGPRRPLGGAPSGGQEDGLRPSFCFGLPKVRPSSSFLLLRLGPTSAQHHCGRFRSTLCAPVTCRRGAAFAMIWTFPLFGGDQVSTGHVGTSVACRG